MSNGGWQPPHSGDTPPPNPGPSGPPAGAFQPPPAPNVPPASTQPVALEPAKQPPSRSKGKVVAAGVGALAIVGAGIFAVTRISGDSTSGGAGSPEEAGQSLVDAIDNEDLLGAVDVLLPGERETLRQPMTDFVDELRRLEVLSDDADLSAIGGVDVVVEDSEIAVEETNVDDIANLTISLDVSASVDGEDLPIGDLVLDNVDADPSEIQVEEGGESTELPITAVREDGRWYVSIFYSAAEQGRIAAGAGEIPSLEDAVAATGGDSPEDALDSFIEGLEALDVEQIIGSLNPDEFQALQRYAPLFLEEAQDELDAAGVEISIDEPEYTVTGDGDTRSMTVSYIAGEITAEGETVGFSYEDGCAVLTPPEGVEDEPINTCELLESPEFDEMFGESSADVERFLDTLAAAFDDYENPGLIVKQVDGRWFLSPFATGSEQVLAVLRALDRDEIEQLAEDGATAVEDVIGSVVDSGMVEMPDEFVEDGDDAEPVDTTEDTVSEDDTDVTMPDFTIPDVTMPDFDVTVPDLSTPDGEGMAACFAEETAADATACYQQLLDAGDIDTFEFPVYLRLPECGLDELYWSGDYYSLPDAEFVAAIEDAAPCFQAAVADGTIDEFEVPTELSGPECLEGRNVYAAEDEEVFGDFLDCVMG